LPAKYRIHPAIGVARLGDSPDEFCISSDTPATVPVECNAEGNPLLSPDGKSEVPIKQFKDSLGRIKRQAARFQIYVYDEASPDGRPLKPGDAIEGGGNAGTLVDIQWRLQGEHGYAADHPLRNADITDENARQQLIIDPGPRYVNTTDRRRAAFDRHGCSVYAPIFPPAQLTPNSIDTLGDILTDNQGRLLVLGGHGNSGTMKKGAGQPRIDSYANTDGWFDDTSDGPVMARLVMYSELVGRQRFVDVEYPAWVIAAYPRYVPQILDMVTLDDVVLDLAVRKFAYRTDLYGIPGTYGDSPGIDTSDSGALQHWNAAPLDWNPDYRPWFYREIWPILFRADEMSYTSNVLQQSNYPHNQTQRGNFDVTKLSVPPVVSARALKLRQTTAARRNHSGELFLEAIELKIHVFDDAVEQAVRRYIHSVDGEPETSVAMPQPGASLFQQLRAVRSEVRVEDSEEGLHSSGLRDAAHAFAESVVSGGGSLEPAPYLAQWKAAYERGGTDYDRAKDALAAAIAKTLKPFIAAAVARWERGVQRTTGLAALLHSARPGLSDHDTIEQLIQEAVRAIQNDVLKNFRSGQLMDLEFENATQAATNDPFRDFRLYLYRLLRRPGEENVFRTAGKPESRLFRLPLMPLLAGDNPTGNPPSKFLRLTDLQLYLLRQWSEGKFYNEIEEGWVPDGAIDPYQPYQNWRNRTGRDLDQAVLAGMLGGAFFPGAEVAWPIRNPALYKEPFRLKADPEFYAFGQTAANQNANTLSEQDYLGNAEDPLALTNDFETGLQPGDLTKYSALPWQADFNECTIQTIDITYELWNKVDWQQDNDAWLKQEQKTWDTLWWPAHRPLQSFEVTSFSGGQPNYQFLGWSRGVPQTLAGDLKMVTEWARLGFIVRNPYMSANDLDAPSPGNKYISVERNEFEPGHSRHTGNEKADSE
jgi:L-Lysine epsilon oxidase N-terminal/L-lysine epsilon oxidase C-terminal domain